MIDAHFHIWQLARGDYGWLTEAVGPIFRDVTLDDWRRVAAPCGVGAGILVQAAPSEAETHFLLRQAQFAPDVLGVVGWVDMLADDVRHRIGALAKDSKLRGLRPMLQDISDPDWVLRETLGSAFNAMLALDLSFDALVKPVHLPRLLKLARRYPELHIVVDHAAKPDIAGGQWQDWADALARLAEQPQVCCKLSGLWTEAGRAATADSLEPYVRHVTSCFGPGRTLWGSDWPVLELAATYPQWHQWALRQVDGKDQGLVFDGVARRVYRL